MKARDVMTSGVVTVPPSASVRQIARLMADKRISGMPVVSLEGEVLGIVSESDLLRRTELGTEPQEAHWTHFFSEAEEQAREFSKSHGRKAYDVMSRPVVSVQDDIELSDVARTLDQHKIKRVPVLRNGKMIGMIARSDLVRALSRAGTHDGDIHLGDAVIHQTISETLKKQPWFDASYLNLTVKEGVVRAWGYVQSKDQLEAIQILISEIPGVVRVDANLTLGVPKLNWDGSQTTG